MKRKIMLVFTLATMCLCVTSCEKDKRNSSADETTAFKAADSSKPIENGSIQEETIDEGVEGNILIDEFADDQNEREQDGQNEKTVGNEIIDYALYSRTTDTVHLRSRPSIDSESIHILGKNTALRVAGIDADHWAQVRTDSGEEGFIFADYIMEPVSEEEWMAYQEQSLEQKVICIDAGHQAHGNNEKEPVGPGASETKAKVSSGTRGVSTGKMEYELTLEVSLKIQEELEQRGYTVIMCRTTNDVNISNAERAAVANSAGVDAFLRIHADGAENASAQGAHTICQTLNNPYNGQLYEDSLRLSQCIISEYLAATGAKQAKADDGVDERDDLSGINWCSVPVTLIELGFMTNPTEDELMSSADYQAKMVTGIANGIDKYFDK